MFVVYGLYCDTGIFYIGKTTKARVHKRLNEHRSAASRKRGNQKVYNKIRKLTAKGEDIELKVIFETDCEERQKQKEIELIEAYGRDIRRGGKLYNSTAGGEGVVGYTYSDEVRKKMSEKKKGHSYLRGTKRPDAVERFSKTVSAYDLDGKIIATYKSQRVLAEELGIDHRVVNSAISRNGTAMSRVLHKRIRAAFGDAPQISANYAGKLLKIAQYDLTGTLIWVYDSIYEAAKAVDSSIQNIRSVCVGKSKTAKNFIWKYQV